MVKLLKQLMSALKSLPLFRCWHLTSLLNNQTSLPPCAAPPPLSPVVSALLSASPTPPTSASPGFSF